MKKLLLLVLAITVFTSCSSDDVIDSDSIIGTWKLISHSDVTPLPDCMKNSVITFKSNGTLAGTVYEADCDKNTVSGSYTKDTDTLYIITIPNANSDTEITAELSSNKLIWTEKNPTKTRVLNFVKN